MSLTVLCNGTRRSFKTSPNMLVQALHDEVCVHFGLDSTRFHLLHRNQALDKAQPLRYCSLPNNCILECVACTANNINSMPCRLAVSIEGFPGSFSGSFTSQESIQDALKYFVISNSLPAIVLEISFEAIYLGNKLPMLAALSSLGLSGKSARIQLRQCTLQQSIQRQEFFSHQDQTLVPSSAKEQVESMLQAPISNETAAIGINNARSEEIQAVRKDILTESVSSHLTAAAPEAETVNSPSPRPSTVDCIQFILANNFDKVSTDALIIIAKYLCNILSDPSLEKYHTINTGNKTYESKVCPAKGASQLLINIGFQQKQIASNNFLGSSLSCVGNPFVAGGGQTELGLGDVIASAPSAGLICLRQVDEAALTEVLREVNAALGALGVSEEDRPRVLVKTATDTATALPAVMFDPYKSCIFTTAPQPRRSDSESVTQLKLQALDKRREELEGSVEAVLRLTQVVWPDQVVSTAEAEEGAEDNRGVNKAILGKIKRLMKGSDDEPPMITAAVRSLHKAEKERVHSRVLMRIRFPDRVCLQGYFHPRQSMLDVYVWVKDCLKKSFETHTKYPFELYSTPPRAVLAAIDTQSLLDLGLAPASLLYCNWLFETPPARASSCSDSACVLPDLTQPLLLSSGWYLSDDLLTECDNKDKDSSSATAAYPTSITLVQLPEHENQQIAGTSDHNIMSRESDDKTIVRKVPKWFKS